MSDELLSYYDRELTYLRRMGAAFAAAHPKIAGRLKLGADSVEDPHVSRLIESVAFLNARIRHKLDDDFPELTDALLSILYPHYLAPIPSCAIVQLLADPDLTAPHRVPRETSIETDRIQGSTCKFRTCYETLVSPLEVSKATVAGIPFRAPPSRHSSSAAGLLELVLGVSGKHSHIAGLLPPTLRFHLAGQEQHVAGLYELLLNGVAGVAIARGPGDPEPILLPTEAIQAVGFEAGESLLPRSARTPRAYTLLMEYFAFPAKFHFVDLTGLDAIDLRGFEDRLHLYFYLRAPFPRLEASITEANFLLGCTPLVNLFQRRAEPIPLTQEKSEYHVLPDARHQLANEVWSIDSVSATTAQRQRVEYLPFFGLHHSESGEGDLRYWYASRRSAPPGPGEPDQGTEVHLSLVDLDSRPDPGAATVLHVSTTCLNRDLPSRLPFGGDQPRMQFSQGAGGIARIRCVTKPTPTRRPPAGARAMWRVVSHLASNHVSLTGEGGTEALREILRIYEVGDLAENRTAIAGLQRLECSPAVARIFSGGLPGMARGTRVRLQLDEDRFSGSSMLLFAAVLDRFLALYAPLNSFVQTELVSNRRQGVVHRWPPRAGDRSLL